MILMLLLATTALYADNPQQPQNAQQTAATRVAPEKKKPWYKTRTAKITAGGVGAGALIGGLAGGRKGTAIGAISGGAAGYIYDQVTRDKK